VSPILVHPATSTGTFGCLSVFIIVDLMGQVGVYPLFKFCFVLGWFW